MKKAFFLFFTALLYCTLAQAQTVTIQVFDKAGKILSTQGGEYALNDDYSYLPVFFPTPVLSGDKIGFINARGNMVIPVKYTPVRKATYNQSNGKMELSTSYHEFNEGIVPLYLDGQCGALDSLGKIVVPFQYKYVDAFYNGLARAMSNNKIGFVNTRGTMAIAEQFDNVTDFSDGYAVATVKSANGNEYCTLVDKTGKLWLAEQQYESIKPFTDVLVKVAYKNEAGIYNIRLNIWFFPMSADKENFKSCETFSDGSSLISFYDNIEKAKVYGVLTQNGRFEKVGNFIDYEWYEAENCFAFSNNYLKYAFFNNSFKQLSGFDFDAVGRRMYNGMVNATKNGKVGVTTKMGVQVIPFEYNKEGYVMDICEVQPNGTITIRQNNQYWCLNTKGEKILPGPYDFLVNVWGGNTYKVKQNGKYGLIDISGKVILPIDNDDLDCNEFKLVKVKKGSKWGFCTADGKMIVPMEYDYTTIKYFDDKKNPVFQVEKGGYVGLLNHQGKWLLPMGYARICYGKGVLIAQKGMSLTELGAAEVKQYKKMLANLGDMATNFEKARNLYNNRANCPGGCLANYKSSSAVFLKEAKALRDYYNNSKTLGTNAGYSYAKAELAKIVSNTETTNSQVQSLSDVASNYGGGDAGEGKLQSITSNVREVQWIIEADTKARKEAGVFNSKINQVAHCLKNYNRSDCESYIAMAKQSLGILKELANDKIRYVRQMSQDQQKKEFGQVMQSAFEDQLRDVEKVQSDLDQALKQPGLLDALIMGMSRAFGSR
jgi:WG containing repeat